jgi:hypothetical protein
MAVSRLVDVSDKTPLIQSWIQLFTNKYEQKKDRLKVALNIEGGWGGGVHSEYLSGRLASTGVLGLPSP